MKKAVFGLANNREHAQRIIEHLHNGGFSYESISVLFADKGDIKINPSTATSANLGTQDQWKQQKPAKAGGNISHERETKGPEGSATGALAGGILGGTLGLLAGLGTIAIPGLGAFVAAGPLMAALGGSAIGGSTGLLVGYLVGMNIPEYVAKSYEGSLKAGNTLVSIHCQNDDEADRAMKILKREGAEQISSTMEKAKASK